MTGDVTVADKKAFIRWFLEQHEMKMRESIWILNFLLGNDALLAKSHVVEEARYCPRAILISSKEDPGVPFRFYKGSLMTEDAEKTFHDLRLHSDEALYLQFNFPSIPPPHEYLAVLEENPFMPKYLHISQTDKIVAERILRDSLDAYQEELFEKQIDSALDRQDKEEFYRLSRLWQAIKEAHPLSKEQE